MMIEQRTVNVEEGLTMNKTTIDLYPLLQHAENYKGDSVGRLYTVTVSQTFYVYVK